MEKVGFSTLSMISTLSEKRGMINTDNINKFYEWFTGFTFFFYKKIAEGNFYIITGKSFAFIFQINLHKQDIETLYYIHKSLWGS